MNACLFQSGGILFAVAALCPPANATFTPAELEKRLAAIRERLGPRLFRREGVRCWACPARLKSQRQVPARGWASRPQPGNGSVTELYCPRCWKKWGWADPK